MFQFDLFISLLKIFIAVSIFFVWVVRYDNIIKEFKDYHFPNWFRDIMGILKLGAAVMLFIGSVEYTIIAATILSILMISAFIVHIKFKHKFLLFLPSLSLTIANIILLSHAFITLN